MLGTFIFFSGLMSLVSEWKRKMALNRIPTNC